MRLDFINQRKKELGLTNDKLSKLSGVPMGTLSKIMAGLIKNPKLDTLQAIAKALGCTLDDFSDESDTVLPPYENIMPIGIQRLPMLGEIACGQPIFASEDRESYVEIGSNIHADFCLRAKGDSMINARILDGDIIFIRKQASVENGEIAAVIINDEATLKRVYYYPERHQITLVAENPTYPPLVYIEDELNTVHILGKAVAFQSDVK